MINNVTRALQRAYHDLVINRRTVTDHVEDRFVLGYLAAQLDAALTSETGWPTGESVAAVQALTARAHNGTTVSAEAEEVLRGILDRLYAIDQLHVVL